MPLCPPTPVADPNQLWRRRRVAAGGVRDDFFLQNTQFEATLGAFRGKIEMSSTRNLLLEICSCLSGDCNSLQCSNVYSQRRYWYVNCKLYAYMLASCVLNRFSVNTF